MRLYIYLLVLSLYAPVPPHRPAKPADHIGSWKMVWSNFIYQPTTFYKDGHYECGAWEGTWKREGEVLTVTEFPKSDPDTIPMIWKIEFSPGKLRGNLRLQAGRYNISLEKLDPEYR